ncbi:MAG: RsmD family RNA methyltransferase [Methanoregula sp.]
MTLIDDLNETIPADKLRGFSGRFDVVGDIAIVNIPSALQGYEKMIVGAILEHRLAIRTVVKKSADVAGDFRTAKYTIIIGTSTVTTHQENGFSYALDLNTSFFNPRLTHERRRVTTQVQAGERVLVPFCGVGPFVIPAAVRGASVVAIEQNPDACYWMEKNIKENRISGRVTVIMGDAFNPNVLPTELFDRAIIPTPYGRDEILGLITSRVREGGMLHFYTFKNRAQSEILVHEFEKTGYRVLTRRRCGNVAPSVSRWAFDLLRQ